MLYCELCGESAYPVTAELTGKPLCEFHYQSRSQKLSAVFAASKSRVIGQHKKPASGFLQTHLGKVHKLVRAAK